MGNLSGLMAVVFLWRFFTLLRVAIAVCETRSPRVTGLASLYEGTGAHTSGVSVCMFEILRNVVNLHRVMSMLKLQINVNVPQLLCIVVSVAQNGEFERFGGFYVNCYYTAL